MAVYASGPGSAAVTGLPIRPDYHVKAASVASCAAPPCQPGETAVDTPRDPEAAKLAKFVLSVADSMYSSPPKPTLHWFKGNSGADGWAPRHAGGRAWVRLADRLVGRELVNVALHEHRHCAHRGLVDDRDAKEADADHFAELWTPAFLAAYRSADGSAWKVNLVDGRPPFGNPGACDVAISRTTRQAYDYSNRRTGDAWQRIS